MECVTQMDGAGLRLGRKKGYFAAVQTVSQAVGCFRAARAWGLAAVSDLPVPSWDNGMRARGAESPALVRRGCCSVLSLQKTHGEERSRQKDHSK